MPSVVASRYARALVDVVLGDRAAVEPERALQEMRAFEQTLKESPELASVLGSPAVAPARKRAVVGRVAASLALSTVVHNFLLVLVDHRRTNMLGEIIGAFETRMDERLGIVPVEVISAHELSQSQQSALTHRLESVTGKRVWLSTGVDPELLGGAMVRIGSTVYDGSVSAQLASLGRRLRAE